MARPTLELWFEFASTYSYLTVSRIERLTTEAGIDLIWRPFLLGPIFQAKGMETSPFLLDATKGAYMWRDMERRAARYGIPFAKPPEFPMNGLTAARIMTASLGTPWCGAFAREVFNAQFARGADISDPVVLTAALGAAGTDPAKALAAAQLDQTKAALRATTKDAAAFGIFGAPSFRVAGELFWGDDRLEDAMDWALTHPAPTA